MIRFSHKILFLFSLMTTSLVSVDSLALGGIGGGRSTKARNNNGVQAVNAYICANLDCSSSNIKIVEKCATHAHMEHGVCMCDEGCIGDGETCQEKTCPEGQKPNSDNSACISCQEDELCSTCPSTKPYANGKGICVEHTTCQHSCSDGIGICECPNGTYCQKGKCLCNGTTKEACGSNGTTVCCAEGQSCSINTWDAFPGICKTKTGECLTSLDCNNPNKYCSFDNGTNNSDFGNGHCIPIEKGQQGNYIYSTETMDWWSAKNWCEAQNAQMIEISTLNCDLGTKGFADNGCTSPSVNLPQFSHFWMKDIPELTWIEDDNSQHSDTTYTFIFSTNFNSLHWLHQKHNFFAKALCKTNED